MLKDIIEYSENIKSFHMPGHKNNKLEINRDLYRADVTEVSGTDDLHHATGIINEVQEKITDIYGSYKSYMMVNGSTGGILSAIASVTKDNDRVVIGRNCHKSVYNSLLLNRLKVNYIYPSVDKPSGINQGFTKNDLVLDCENIEIKAVIVTSPTYEGYVSDIKEIGKWAHALGAVLIVDEAHGAHFTFSKNMPLSALELGADIVVQSTHKTLPCMTQTAILHISKEAVKTGRVDVNRVQKHLGIYQSSSPSYVLMTSIEVGIDYMDKHRKEFDKLIKETKQLKKEYNHLSDGVGEWLDGEGLDPIRLTYKIKTDKITGWELEKVLRTEHNIQVELSSKMHIVAIVTIADQMVEIEELMSKVNNIVKSYCKTKDSSFIKGEYEEDIRPVSQYTFYEANQKEYKLIPLLNAEGSICHEYIIPYPPGIPLLVPGEVISIEMVRKLSFLLNNGHEVYGIIEGEIEVLIERGIE